MLRCLDGLAEVALAERDSRRCLACAEALLALAESNGLREVQANARRWRGEALLMENRYAEAQAELFCGVASAEEVGRVRLQIDLQSALARLFAARGLRDAVQRHGAKGRAIRAAIETRLVSAGLESRLSPIDVLH